MLPLRFIVDPVPIFQVDSPLSLCPSVWNNHPPVPPVVEVPVPVAFIVTPSIFISWPPTSFMAAYCPPWPIPVQLRFWTPWFVAPCPAPCLPVIVIPFVDKSNPLPEKATFIVPPFISICANGATLPPELIHISSPLPVPGGDIVAIVTVGTAGAAIFGVTGLKLIACGKFGCVACNGVTVGAVNALGVIPALTSNAIIGSLTGLVLAKPYPFGSPLLWLLLADLGFVDRGNSE